MTRALLNTAVSLTAALFCTTMLVQASSAQSPAHPIARIA